MVAYDPAQDSWTNQFANVNANVNPSNPGSDLTNAWSNAAPALPSGLILQLSQAGVSPADPVGAWVLRTGLPALGSAKPAAANMTEGLAASRVLGDPALLAQIKKLPLDKQEQVFKMSAVQAGAMSDQDLQRLAQTGSTHAHHGIFNKIGDVLTTGARDAFTVLQAPAEAGTAAYRDMTAMANRNPGPDPFGMKEKIQTPGMGTVSDTLDQITLTHALQGESLGTGFFPAGPAHEQAVQAQRAAASIDGHALTPGRALASMVVQPGTRPYGILSGMVDGTIAVKGDPSALLLGELSDAAKASRVFAPTSDSAIASAAKYLVDGANNSTAVTALRQFSGSDNPNLVHALSEKIKADPGSLQQLVDHPDLNVTHADILKAVAMDHTGGMFGWRHMLDRPTALNWLNSEAGIDYAQKTADSGFTDIWLRSGRKLPVDVVSQLASATNPDEVRAVLGTQIGSLVRDVPESSIPYAWTRTLQESRLAQYLPKGYVDVDHLDTSVEQTYRMLKAAKVSPAFYDDLLGDVARSTDRTSFYSAYTQAIDAVKDTLTDHGVDPDLAHKLTRFVSDDTIEHASRFVDEVGNVPHINGLTTGDTIPIIGPHMSSELLNRALPTLDMRDIQRLVGQWGPLWQHPTIGPMLKASSHVADWLTGTFKVFTLLKGALPVRFLADEQARMASAGLESMFNHPLSYISHVISGNADVDALGERFADQLGDMQSQVRQAVGETSRWENSIWDADTKLAKHYVTYAADAPDSKGYLRAWGDELSHLHVTPEAREVARALQNVEYVPNGVDGVAGLDAVKQSFWDGPLSKFRKELATAGVWGGQSFELGSSRNFADQYIDSVADRVKLATSEHPELVDAVANGGGFSMNGVSKDFKKTLADLHGGEGIGPQSVRGLAAETAQGQPHVMRNMVSKMFGALMDTPTSTLTRSPAFKQYYLQRFDELAPYVKDGTIDAVKADTIAKDFGLKQVEDLLYYPGRRTLATEKLRNIAPFGEAWRNVVKTWAKLGVENPAIFRRVQQGVTAARESGFFYQDPESGKEVFTMVPAGIMKHLAGVPFPMTAPVAGINIVGSGLPGVGPAVQIPANALLPHGNKWSDLVRQHLLPYGSPDYTGGFAESLLPGWLDKMVVSGMLLHYLPGSKSLPFITPSANQTRVLQNLGNAVVAYHLSSGNYDITNPDVLHKLTTQSLWEARKLYVLRGMAQFAAPAAPTVTDESQLKNGSLVQTWLLAKDFQTMENTYPNFSDAVMSFVNKYGPKLIYATEPMARPLVYGTPTTEEAEIWKSQHGDFASEFPTTFGYWAPTQGQFSYQAYLDSIKNGDMSTPSMDDWVRLAQARLGNAVYDRFRAMLPVSPSSQQRDWLASQKQKVTAEFPGFNDDSLKLQRKTLDQSVTELKAAVQSPTVAKTPLAQAASAYIRLRDEALSAAQSRSGSTRTGLSGQSDADIRAWLYQQGTRIALEVPDFATMWQNLFLNEVDESQTQ